MEIDFIRGDTQIISFDLVDSAGNKLILSSTDKLYFTVKKSADEATAAFQKTNAENGGIVYDATSGYYKITIDPADTDKLDYGMYPFDIELKSDALVKTLAIGAISLSKEVTFAGNEV